MSIRKEEITVFFIFLFLSFCKFPPLVAPDGAILNVSVNPVSIALGHTATVTVTGFRETGPPLPDGSIIYFSSTIGSIDSQSSISNGIARAIFRSNDGISGEAMISVSSGNAEVIPESVFIIVGNAALEYLFLTASPQTLPPEGGNAEITISAFDKDMNPLSSIPVILTTSVGNLRSNTTLYTDTNGNTFDTLETFGDATVTAKSGSVSGSISISVEKPPAASFTFSPSNPAAGDSVNFDASASSDPDGTIIEYKWDFGDGKKGTGMNVTHTFNNSGTYNVILTVIDNSGNSSTTSRDVNVST